MVMTKSWVDGLNKGWVFIVYAGIRINLNLKGKKKYCMHDTKIEFYFLKRNKYPEKQIGLDKLLSLGHQLGVCYNNLEMRAEPGLEQWRQLEILKKVFFPKKYNIRSL